MSKLRCYPPTGGHYGNFVGKEWVDEDDLMRERNAG